MIATDYKDTWGGGDSRTPPDSWKGSWFPLPTVHINPNTPHFLKQIFNVGRLFFKKISSRLWEWQLEVIVVNRNLETPGWHFYSHRPTSTRRTWFPLLLAEALEYVTAGVLTCFQLAMRIIRYFGAAWWESSCCHLSASMTFRISCTMEKGIFHWHCEVILPSYFPPM